MPFSFEKTQENKPVTIASDGVTKYIDFLYKDINIINSGDPPSIRGYYVIPNDYAMRPDLCCKDLYIYEDDYMENMLKFNGISNPFVLDGGDVLGNYEPYSMQKSTRNTQVNKQQREDIRKQYITPEKKSQVDPRLQEFEKRNKTPKKPSDATFLPPNFAAFGDKEINIRGGKVYFGEGVSKTKGSNDQPLSKSEFIARLIKNQKKK